MRAKECLEALRGEIYKYDLVKRIIYDLLPLRTDKLATVDYFNEHLFADARYRYYKSISNGSFSENDFSETETEISRTIVERVRCDILSVIYSDETFIYAYNIIVLGVNFYDQYSKLRFCEMKEENGDTISNIEKIIKCYKEDYPKTILADYMLDVTNWDFYEAKYSEYQKEDDWWLNAFNIAYEIFDKVRIKHFDPSNAQYIIKNIYLNDKKLEKAVIEIIKNLFLNYTYHLSSDQVLKYSMLCKKIDEYEKGSFIKVDKSYQSKIEEVNLSNINWLNATKKFNYEVMNLWIWNDKFNQEQRFYVIDQMEKRFNKEREKNPELFIYDLSGFFQKAREEVKFNYINVCNEIETKNLITEKNYIEEPDLNIQQKEQEIEELKNIVEEKDRTITELLAEIDLINDDSGPGMTVGQLAITFYYLFNELGLNFSNSDKTDWAKFINAITGKSYERIRRAFPIDCDTKISKKNLRIVGELYKELFPGIRQKIINDIK